MANTPHGNASTFDDSVSSDSENDVDYVPNEAASDSSIEDETECVSESESLHLGALHRKETKSEQKNKVTEIKSDLSSKVAEKQRAKDLWQTHFINEGEPASPKKSCSPKIDIKPVSKVFEFAGEIVSGNKNGLISCDSTNKELNNAVTVSPSGKPPCVPKRGISSVLGAIGSKNKKLTVLEKSIMDWETFKQEEGIESELQKYNKGKQGFMERQRFLDRSDMRSFEVEKSVKHALRRK